MTREEQQLEEFRRKLDERLAKHSTEPFEQQQARRVSEQAHVQAAIAAKIDPNLNAKDAASAKAYVRGRAFQMLRQSWDVVEKFMGDPEITPTKKISTAFTIIHRAAGPAEAPNGIRADLSEMPPVDAIDYVLNEYADGNVTEEFVRTILGLLAAKVQGLGVEGLVEKAIKAKAAKEK